MTSCLFSGCFQKASFLCGSKKGTILGTICQFAYSELENATNKFSNSNLVGLGGSSYVYRGQLNDGRIVAVKRLKVQGSPDADSFFSTEVQSLLAFHFVLLKFLVNENSIKRFYVVLKNTKKVFYNVVLLRSSCCRGYITVMWFPCLATVQNSVGNMLRNCWYLNTCLMVI